MNMYTDYILDQEAQVKKNVLYIDEVYAVDELLTDFKYTDARICLCFGFW